MKNMLYINHREFAIKICDKGETVDNIKVNKYLKDNVEVVLEEEISLLNEKGSNIEYDKKIDIDKDIKAPLKKGDKVGESIYTDSDGNVVGKANIVVKEDVKRAGILQYVKYALKTYVLGSEII